MKSKFSIGDKISHKITGAKGVIKNIFFAEYSECVYHITWNNSMYEKWASEFVVNQNFLNQEYLKLKIKNIYVI